MDQQRQNGPAIDSPAPATIGYRVGCITLDVERRCVRRDGRPVALGALSFDLLLALVRRAPATVSANSLLDEVWPDAVVGPDALTQRVKLLRAALGDDAARPQYIESLRGKGYRIVAPVTALTEIEPPEANAATPMPDAAPGVPAQMGPAKPSLHRFASLPAIAGIFVALVASITVAWLHWGRQTEQSATLSSGSASTAAFQVRPRIAVLPLGTLGADTDVSFADGMHEEIISALAQLAPSVDVISRTTMLTFRDGSRSLPEIGRLLNASYVMEGTVQREANRVKLSLQLVDARTESHVWSQRYERTLTSALTLQAEVAQSVASQIAGRVPTRLAPLPPPPHDPVAHDLYLDAHVRRAALVVTDPPDAVMAVEKTISDAIRREPTYGLAYIERFQLCMLRLAFSQGDAMLITEQMRADLDAAQRLIPGSAAVMQAEGELAAVNHQRDRALAMFDAAEAAGLIDSYLLVFRAGVMARMGLVEQGMPFLDRAAQIDPRNPTILFYKAINLVYLRRPAEAIAIYRSIATQYPERAKLANSLARLTRMLFAGSDEELPADSLPRLLHQGSYSEALAQLAKVTPKRGIFWPGAAQQLLLTQGAGELPLRAIVEGRLNLLLGNRRAAAKNGLEILAFVTSQRESAFNRWQLRNLTAVGQLLTGDHAGAIKSTHEALALAPRSVDLIHWTIAATRAAETLAWAGAPDEAMNLLEQLATDIPGLPPSAIAREPQFTIPLAANHRFQALRTRLEAQMALTRF